MCLPRRISLSLSTITLLTWCVLGTIGAGSQSAFAAHEQDIDDVINWVACQAGDGSDCGSFPGGQSLPSRYSAEQVEAALRGGVLETRDHVRNAYRELFQGVLRSASVETCKRNRSAVGGGRSRNSSSRGRSKRGKSKIGGKNGR